MQLFLSAPPALSMAGRARYGYGQSCTEGFADSVLWFLLFQAFLPALGWSQASEACPTQGKPPPRGLESPQPILTYRKVWNSQQGQSVTSCDTIVSTRSLRGRLSQSRPRIFSKQSIQWRWPPVHALEVTISRGLFLWPGWDRAQTSPGDIFNLIEPKLCLYWYRWQAPSLGNEGMWYLSRGNNKAPCLATRTMSASEVLMIKARV